MHIISFIYHFFEAALFWHMYMLFMLLASAAFKGEDIQNFGEGGRTLYGGA